MHREGGIRSPITTSLKTGPATFLITTTTLPKALNRRVAFTLRTVTRNPRLREISEVSNVVRGLQRGYELHRVCFPAEVKAEVYKLYHDLKSTDALAMGT